MPCLNLSTNVDLDGIDLDPIFAELTKCVSTIMGKPEHFVMVLIKGSVEISFGKNKEAAAYGEVVAMGGLDSAVKKRLIAEIGAILKNRFDIPNTRFFLKVYDTTMAAKLNSKI
uniref:Macrophage migration inhibitory factor n=1 Tax=Kalanchoe fedtschenkoi TaxID=63787 RepID=A0A7N0ZST4_KALFE